MVGIGVMPEVKSGILYMFGDKMIKNYIYEKPKDYSIVTLGQMHHILEKGWTGWWSDYLIKSNAT